MSFAAVGRKYSVSDNAARRWLRWHERQTDRAARQRDASGEEVQEAA